MKGRLVFKTTDKQRIEYLFEDDFYGHEYDYTIWIGVPKERKLDIKQLKIGLNKYFLRKLNGKQYRKDFPERVELINTAYTEGIDLFDACEKVEVEESLIDVIPSIPNGESKKIIIDSNPLPLDINIVEKLEEQYQGYDNIYIKVDGNDEPISLTEYRQTTEIIDGVVNRIKSYNLSPLEQIIYAYDYARDRIYQKEQHGEAPTTSRDLTRVLLGDEIVCVGYARIFIAILKKLGINAAEYTVQGSEYHSIAIAHIKDEKYGIDSIYYFDPTFDRKRDETNNHFNRYYAFAKNRVEILESFGYNDLTFGEVDESQYLKIIRKLHQEEKPKWFGQIQTKYINNMCSFISGKPMDIEVHGCFGTTEKIIENENAESELIDCHWYLLPFQNKKALVKAMSVVRKIEYYEDPEKYPYSDQTMRTITSESYWNYPYRYDTNTINKILSDNSERYNREASEIDLVKVLRKIKTKKEQQKSD